MKTDAFAKVMKATALELRDPKQLLTDIGLVAEGNTKRVAPVAPVGGGTYRRSITSRVEGNATYIGSAVTYAPFLEYGTRYMDAQMPINTGIYDSRAEIERRAAEYGFKLFEKVARG